MRGFQSPFSASPPKPQRFEPEGGRGASGVILSATKAVHEDSKMIVSAMIFAGMTLLIGGMLGFLLGQARARMTYEEKLVTAEAERAELESRIADLGQQLRQSAPSNAAAAPAQKNATE
jgi:hypothetical protein